MRSTDLIIVGGGFAGLACAASASWRGLRAVVLESKVDPGIRPHTTGLLVKEVADAWDIPRRLTRKIHGVRLYAPNLHSVDLSSPGYYFLATDTANLMRWWARQAREAGAQVMCRSPYRGARFTNDGVVLKEYGLRGKYLVGADGARSRVAVDLGLARNHRFLRGIEAEFEGVRGVDLDRLHVFLDSKLAPGYIGWVVPGVGMTQVGLAVRQPYSPQLDAFIERVSSVFNFDGARLVGRRGGLIPVGGPVRRFARPRAMLVGDAAGMVSPLTAGGIHTAIHFGRQAAVAICDYLLDGGLDPAVVMRRQIPRFAVKRVMRGLFNFCPPNALYNIALSSRPLRSLAQVVFYHHRGLLSPAAWRDAFVALAGR